MKITVNRLGEFSIVPPTIGPQCGSNSSDKYAYHVSITGLRGKLTQEGFVIDNLEIEKYFRELYDNKPMEGGRSCELMACDAIDYFRDLIKKQYQGVACVAVKVKISGSLSSFIEAEWNQKK